MQMKLSLGVKIRNANPKTNTKDLHLDRTLARMRKEVISRKSTNDLQEATNEMNRSRDRALTLPKVIITIRVALEFQPRKK